MRFRPMLVTALAVVGASVILMDPIFQGLAIALMVGEIASLLVSRIAVPVIYYMVNRHAHPEADGGEGVGAARMESPHGFEAETMLERRSMPGGRD